MPNPCRVMIPYSSSKVRRIDSGSASAPTWATSNGRRPTPVSSARLSMVIRKLGVPTKPVAPTARAISICVSVFPVPVGRTTQPMSWSASSISWPAGTRW